MTIEELYQWAKANECTDYEINIECYDEDGDVSETWLDDVWLLKVRDNSSDILIKTPLKKLQSDTKSPLKKFRRHKK